MSSPLSHASPKPLGSLPPTIVVNFHFFCNFFERVKTYLGAQVEKEIRYIYKSKYYFEIVIFSLHLAFWEIHKMNI
jgi:outer membrane protein W